MTARPLSGTFEPWASPEPSASTRLAPVVTALSQALDLSTGQPAGHSVRATILGMRIARHIGLSDATCNDLFYALLLKDCGCSANASKMFHAFGSDDRLLKRDAKTLDWTKTSREVMSYVLSHIAPGKSVAARARTLLALARNRGKHAQDVIRIRCERGASLVHLMGLSAETGSAILSLDEHWNGQGQPEGLRGEAIPILARIMLLAQVLDVFWTTAGAAKAIDVAKQRSRKWFDPELVKAAVSLHCAGLLWANLEAAQTSEVALDCESKVRFLNDSKTGLDQICVAFAQIVDAKSPFTFQHSSGVANAAVAIGQALELPRDRIVFLRHAGLLHDLGKLAVSNVILEKPGKLDAEEWSLMRQHPFYTWKILNEVPGFGEMSEVAASHHEKLNGSGYHRGLTGEHLSTESRILAVADIFDALSADRPYRKGMPLEKVFEILRKDVPHALDVTCVEALEQCGLESDQTFHDLSSLTKHLNTYEVLLARNANSLPQVASSEVADSLRPLTTSIDGQRSCREL